MNVWKIAPGTGAEDWPESLEYECIGLGWIRLPDFRIFHSHAEVLSALIDAYPSPNEKEGHRGGAATSIWYFVDAHDNDQLHVQEGDIVVANQGRSRVVGIGVVTSS